MIRPGAVICRSMMLRYSPIYQFGGKQEENKRKTRGKQYDSLGDPVAQPLSCGAPGVGGVGSSERARTPCTFCKSSCKDTSVTGQRYPIWRLWWWEGSLIHREIASTQ